MQNHTHLIFRIQSERYSRFVFLCLFAWICLGTLVSSTWAVEGEEYAWQSVYLGGGGCMRYVSVNSADSDTIYAACDVAGTFITQNGGESWDFMYEGYGNDLHLYCSTVVSHPKDPNIVYCVNGLKGTPGGVWRYKHTEGKWELLDGSMTFETLGSYPENQRPARYLLAISPTHPNIMYAASMQDGIYKSTSGGKGFKHVGLRGAFLSGVFADPIDPNIAYAAVYTYQGKPGAVYKTIDGGGSWQAVLENEDVRCIAINPLDNRIAYALCAGRGLFKTTDSGKTWALSNGKGSAGLPAKGDSAVVKWTLQGNRPPYLFTCVAIDPKRPNTLYVSSRAHNTLWRSDDGGRKWQHKGRVILGDWWGTGLQGIVHIGIDPTNTNRIYCSDAFTVHRSDDRGDTWKPIPNGLENTIAHRIFINPQEPEKIYLGMCDVTLFISKDRGKSFKYVPHPHGTGRVNVCQDLAFDLAKQTMYMATHMWKSSGGGVYKMSTDGTGWTSAYKGLPNKRVIAIAMDPKNPKVLYAGVENNGIFKTTNGAKDWSPCNNGIKNPRKFYGYMDKSGMDFCYRANIVVDYTNSNIVYATAAPPGKVYKSLDAAGQWQPANKGLPNARVYVLVMHPKNPLVLYAACGNDGLFMTKNGGASWSRLGGFGCHFISIHPARPEILAAGSTPPSSIRTPTLKKSYDSGRTWVDINLPFKLAKPSNVNMDPVDPNILYLATNGHGVFRGVLGGEKTPGIARRIPGQKERSTRPTAAYKKPDLSIGKAAPAFTAPLLGGSLATDKPDDEDDAYKVKFPEDYKNKVVLLHFWSMGFRPSIQNAELMAAIYNKYHAQGLEILGINLDKKDRAEKIPAFVQKTNMTWPHVYDGQGRDAEVFRQYGVALPCMLLVDGSKGTVLAGSKELYGEVVINGNKVSLLEQTIQQALSVVLPETGEIQTKGPAASTGTPSLPSASLHETAKQGNVAQVKALITSSTINTQNEEGHTPLYAAIDQDHLEVVELLVAKGADVKITDKYGYTPLHVAASHGQKEIVALLLFAGASVNDQKNQDGVTPLHMAALWGREETAGFLIEQGANVNAKSKSGQTSLHLAVSWNRTEMVQLLITKGADVNAKDAKGKTALSIAEAKGNKELVDLLFANGAKAE